MTVFRPYKSYNFTTKDPVIDELRTLVQDAGASYKQINEESGVSTSCLYGWFNGATRRPSHAAVAAVASVLGYDFVVQKRSRGKIIKFEPRQQRKPLKRAAAR
jgi:transcriptional regulator with XRE-family HTH domain